MAGTAPTLTPEPRAGKDQARVAEAEAHLIELVRAMARLHAEEDYRNEQARRGIRTI